MDFATNFETKRRGENDEQNKLNIKRVSRLQVSRFITSVYTVMLRSPRYDILTNGKYQVSKRHLMPAIKLISIINNYPPLSPTLR